MKNVGQIIKVLAAVLIGVTFISSLAHAQQTNPNKLPTCVGDYYKNRPWNNCWGEHRHSRETYTGEFLNHRYDGFGIYTNNFGNRYAGNFRNGYFHGPGILTFPNGEQQEGIWENEKFIGAAKVNSPNLKTNPNKLPQCPKPNYSKNTDLERVSKWTKCWGRYQIELEKDLKGDVLEGEWQNGLLNGQGTYYYLAINWKKSDKYVGEFKDGKFHGQGTYISVGKYIGERSQLHDGDAYTWLDWSQEEGIWENGNFIREAKVNLPNFDHNIAADPRNNPDIDRKLLELAIEIRRLGKEKEQQQAENNQDNNPSKLPPCRGTDTTKWTNCFGSESIPNGNNYTGDYLNGMKHGYGVMDVTIESNRGDKYVGEFKYGKKHGQGTFTWTAGAEYRGEFKGIWENDEFIREAEVNLPNLNNNIAINTDRTDIDRERQQLAEERRRLEEEKLKQQAENNQDNNPNKRPPLADSRRRLALVIGNATYKNSPLRNPINDADLISKALSSSGFIVSRYDNLTYAKMREVVRIFGEKLERGDVGLFYFSGHGVQYRGKNYLLPINEDLKHADEIPSTALDIDLVLAKMETAKNDLNIVILDACRSSPFGSEARNLDRGLTTISAGKGTFVAFATSPGNIALDGTGRNSPYTKNLAQAILKGGLTLEQVFKEVRRNVIKETNSQQVPWENSSLLGDFYFK